MGEEDGLPTLGCPMVASPETAIRRIRQPMLTVDNEMALVGLASREGNTSRDCVMRSGKHLSQNAKKCYLVAKLILFGYFWSSEN